MGKWLDAAGCFSELTAQMGFGDAALFLLQTLKQEEFVCVVVALVKISSTLVIFCKLNFKIK